MLSASLLSRFIRLSPEVSCALRRSEDNLLTSKIVLLESAILTHGMPYPQNYEMALKGAIPATVGIMSGLIHVGMNDQQLRHLSSPTSSSKLKVSRRDLPFALSSGSDGGTTVSGTLVIASSVIHGKTLPIFVTGGIGGVHRGGEHSMDVSADLMEMGRSPAMVVSAGVKSILDIGRTLECLETQGVCVATFGEERDFPAFFSKRSGFMSPYKVSSIAEAADLLTHHREFALSSGILLGVPIPERAEEEGQAIESAIQQALKEAQVESVAGRDVTPFVLRRVDQLTGGKSLKANLALIENNADIGAQIAVEVAARVKNFYGSSPRNGGASELVKRPAVIGGSVIDLVTSVTGSNFVMGGSTNGGRISFGFGGVGRNLADALACFDTNPVFVSAIGDDDMGKTILAYNEKLSKKEVLVLQGSSTAMYSLLLDRDGEVRVGVGDMSIHSQIDPSVISANADKLLESSMLVLDGNLNEDTINSALVLCQKPRIPVFFEPTDVNKARKVLSSPAFSSVTFCSPNIYELQSLSGCQFEIDQNNFERLLEDCVGACQKLLSTLQVILVTMGDRGVLVVRRGSSSDALPTENDPVEVRGDFCISAKYYPVEAPPVESVVCVSGAGDCFAAAFIASVLRGRNQDQAVSAGMQAAKLSLADFRAVPSNLDSALIDWSREATGRIL